MLIIFHIKSYVTFFIIKGCSYRNDERDEQKSQKPMVWLEKKDLQFVVEVVHIIEVG